MGYFSSNMGTYRSSNMGNSKLCKLIFLFISGFFFKKIDFGDFTKKQVNGLLIPFIFFYLISYPFRIIVHYWDFKTLDNFDWLCILDVFDSVACHDYMFVNVPLWFILCIFIVRYYYWFMCSFSKYLLIVISIILLLNYNFIYNIATPFMMNNALYWLGFFILGNLYGKDLITVLTKIKYRVIILLVTGIVSVGLFLSENIITNDVLLNIVTHIERLSTIIFTISVFSNFNGESYMTPFKFFGENSLQVLGYHILILIPFSRVAFRLTRTHEPYIGFVCAVLTAFVLYFVIRFSNKYIAQLVGKKNMIK